MHMYCTPAIGDGEGEACDVFGLDQLSGGGGGGGGGGGVTPGSGTISGERDPISGDFK